jgi:hypothetical protein
MGKRPARARLRLHRETVRTLTGRQLADIAGGTLGTTRVISTSLSGYNTDPKSNLWTGSDPDSNGICNA